MDAPLPAPAAPPPAPGEPPLPPARPRVGVGVALVRVSDGALLVGLRRGSHGAGALAFPGGHLEGGEAWADCAAREVREETGLDLPPARFAFAGATNDVMPERGLHYVTLFMAAGVADDEAARVVNAEPAKCDGWAWAPAASLVRGGGAGGGPPLFTSLANWLAGGHAEAALAALAPGAAAGAGGGGQ